MPRFLPRASLLTLATSVALAGASLLLPRVADAFCGFYVSGADARLYNNATNVVLMRDGTRTVLSMQNNYQGPPQDFAMVVPVPVVLQKRDVKVLPREIFDRVDQLAAPRLVEYWEQDPCWVDDYGDEAEGEAAEDDGGGDAAPKSASRDLGVKVEARFAVGEYEIVILSARDSLGLDTWLRANRYNIPAGAEEVLRPYVHAGMKFFVAKVNVAKVRFAGEQAMLSPLRFHYDTQQFSLPVRLGLLNSSGAQDLLVHILARNTRYQVANYRNVAIPTNIDVADATRARFGQFYAALFDRVLRVNPGAVVTEYAWAAGSCDPCPIEPLTLSELMSLGADVLPSYERALAGPVDSSLQWQVPGEFVLTRLHARYSRESLGEDLVFQAAPAIIGGREVTGPDGHAERGATESSYNNFQARYIIRHRWQGPVNCPNPEYGRWGGPPANVSPGPNAMQPAVARDLAFVARDAPLEQLVAEEVPGIATPSARPASLPPSSQPGTPDARAFPNATRSGCASCSVEGSGHGPIGLALACLGLAWWRRRRA